MPRSHRSKTEIEISCVSSTNAPVKNWGITCAEGHLLHFEEKASEVFLEKSMGRNLRIYKWFIAVCIGLTVVPSTVLALNLVLACEGKEESIFFFYDKKGQLSDSTKENADKLLTLQILNSKNRGYPCREYEDIIYCAPCVGSPDKSKCEKNLGLRVFDYTSINRLTGQASVSTTFQADEMRVLTTFEGSCTETKSRKF